MTRAPSQPFADIGVAYARREEAEPEGQHGDVKHEMFLCFVSGTIDAALTHCQAQKCHPGHRFSR